MVQRFLLVVWLFILPLVVLSRFDLQAQESSSSVSSLNFTRGKAFHAR
jgi:hypothetical protein